MIVVEAEIRENKKFFEAVRFFENNKNWNSELKLREESYEIPPDRLEQMDEDPEYWEKYSWNNLFYYRSLSPSRHFRYSCPAHCTALTIQTMSKDVKRKFL